MLSYRVSVELARGTPKGKDALTWQPPSEVTLFEAQRTKQPMHTDYRLKVENLSTAVGWQVRAVLCACVLLLLGFLNPDD